MYCKCRPNGLLQNSTFVPLKPVLHLFSMFFMFLDFVARNFAIGCNTIVSKTIAIFSKTVAIAEG